MAATDAQIAGICPESRTASNGTSPGVPNPQDPKQIQEQIRTCFCLFEQFWGNKAKDYILGDDLEALEAKGVLTHLRPAFSRDFAKKVYIQDRIKEEAY